VLSQISASEKLLSVLNNLYQRGVLDRFVVDEAHCVSQARLAIRRKLLSVVNVSAAAFVKPTTTRLLGIWQPVKPSPK